MFGEAHMRYSHYFLGIVAPCVPAAAQTQTQTQVANVAKPSGQVASACDVGTGSACHDLAEKLRFGNRVDKDAPRARRSQESGCSLNEARSCLKITQ